MSPRSRPPLCCTLALLALLAGAPPASAAPALLLAQAEAQLTAAQAAERVRRQLGGKVLKVEQVERDGRVFYRVRILQEDGRIRTLLVDARTGRLLGR